MSEIDDGGPAFPESGSRGKAASGEGMSLRDYFAIHGDQPGQLEIAAEAGVRTREYCGQPWTDAEATKLPAWAEWFHALPQEERYRLYARVRYRIADAMIAARQER